MLIYLHFLYLQTVGGGCCYAGIRPNIPDFAPLRRLIAHTSRTRKGPPSPSCLPVPDPSPDQPKGPLREPDRLTPHAQPRQAETRVDQGLAPTSRSLSSLQTFCDLIDLHITDMCEVGKPPSGSEERPRVSQNAAGQGAGRPPRPSEADRLRQDARLSRVRRVSQIGPGD